MAIAIFFSIIFIPIILGRALIRNKRNYCHIRTSIEVSTNGGCDYQKHFDIIRFDNKQHVFYIKYEVTASIRCFLYNFLSKEFPFNIEIPKAANMMVLLHEYSGICNPDPVDGLMVTEKTRFSVFAMNKRAETVKIVLRCEYYPAKENLYYFKLRFHDKQINEKCAKAVILGLNSDAADSFI
jgi:hypothetical protein